MTDISKKIKEDFKEIRLIVLQVNKAYNAIHFIKSNGADVITSDYKIFGYILYCIGSSLVIDLCKLFDTNTYNSGEKKKKKHYAHYSFNLLFLNLKQHYEQIEWYCKPDEDLIEDLVNELNNELKASTVVNLKEARDKFYAHLDKNRSFDLQINFEQIESLIYLAQRFVNDIYNYLHGCFQSFDILNSEDTSKLMIDLYRFKQIKQVINNGKEDRKYTFEKILGIVGDKV